VRHDSKVFKQSKMGPENALNYNSLHLMLITNVPEFRKHLTEAGPYPNINKANFDVPGDSHLISGPLQVVAANDENVCFQFPSSVSFQESLSSLGDSKKITSVPFPKAKGHNFQSFKTLTMLSELNVSTEPALISSVILSWKTFEPRLLTVDFWESNDVTAIKSHPDFHVSPVAFDHLNEKVGLPLLEAYLRHWFFKKNTRDKIAAFKARHSAYTSLLTGEF
jgi:hypothetical protein